MRNGEGECTKDGTILPKISGLLHTASIVALCCFIHVKCFVVKRNPGLSIILSKKDENMMDECPQYKRVLHLGESCHSIKEKEINQTNKVDEDQKL